MDQAVIGRLIEQYRHLSPEALAGLDDERHQLSGEEATALDAVMHADDLRQPIARAVATLDAKKRHDFRADVIIFALYIVLQQALSPWFQELAGGIGWLSELLAVSAALAIFALGRILLTSLRSTMSRRGAEGR